MNVIIVKKDGESKHYALSWWARACLFGAFLVLPGLGAFGFWLFQHLSTEGLIDSSIAHRWEEDIAEQRTKLDLVKKDADLELTGLTVKLAQLQSRLMRLDALGEHLIDVADLPEDEFNFANVPAVGGPTEDDWGAAAYSSVSIDNAVAELARQISDREQQLQVLDDLMSAAKISSSTFIAGRPIVHGWMSSRYGKRIDPFTGRIAWHAGVDFAGKLGSDVVAVASGVVTWAKKRYGYGRLVEVSHGNGYKTRYGHCQSINVKVGEVVRQGDVVCAMGSSGRSTGPHVHFEVYKNGRTVDPASYIHRKPR